MRGNRHRPAADRDAGSGSVWVLSLSLALLTVAVGLTGAGAALAQRARAGAAADLAALVAADVLQHGGSSTAACAAASALAERNSGTLTGCAVTGNTVDVEVAAVRAIAGFRLAARARAGPVRGG